MNSIGHPKLFSIMTNHKSSLLKIPFPKPHKNEKVPNPHIPYTHKSWKKVNLTRPSIQLLPQKPQTLKHDFTHSQFNKIVPLYWPPLVNFNSIDNYLSSKFPHEACSLMRLWIISQQTGHTNNIYVISEVLYIPLLKFLNFIIIP
jgi:hypothetical protein